MTLIYSPTGSACLVLPMHKETVSCLSEEWAVAMMSSQDALS